MSTLMPFTSSSGRSSPSEVFLEKGVLKICSKFTGEHLASSSGQSLQACWHCMKNVCIWSFSGPYFPAFVICSIFTLNARKCRLGKLRIQTLFTQCDFFWHSPGKESTHWGYNGCQSSWSEEGQVIARSWSTWRSWSIWRRFVGWFMENNFFATVVNLLPKKILVLVSK